MLVLDIEVPKNGYLYTYLSNESNWNSSVYFDDFTVEHTGLDVVQSDDFYAFGMSFNQQKDRVLKNKYLYNGKELSTDLGLNWYDYGARMYMPDLGRWGMADPAADLLEMSSPYVYALNDPTVYIDKDGELPIFINGRVSSNNERGSAIYWDSQLLETVKGSGVPNPGATDNDWAFFVDGDRGYNHSRPLGQRNDPLNASSRIALGRREAEKDFDAILSKLERDPESGKIIEKIQIYTHSRGSAFGQGYTQGLMEMIQKYADQFEDPSGVIDFVLNLAPHQSNAIDAVDGVPTYSASHYLDLLSGNDVAGSTNFHSYVGSLITAHQNKSFNKELGAFLDAFVGNNNKMGDKAVNDFVKHMKDKYDITVNVSQ